MDSSSEPFFLGNKKFLKSNNFEELKTTSLVLGSDLRYFSKNNEIGIHISDASITEVNLFSILKDLKNIKSDGVLKVLYLSRTNVGRLQPDSIIPYFKNLEFLCISKNTEIKKLELNNISNLKELVAFGNEMLEELKFIGSFLKLEKLDASNCRLTSLDVSNIPSLEYLNVSNNKIETLFLSNSKNLKYFFADGNTNLSLDWPKKWVHNKLEILGLNESNKLISKDILEISKSSSDNELRENLKAYLKFEQKHEDDLVPINRHQIILLGNTTAGKTELVHRLFDIPRTNNDSTHGVKYFLEKVGDIEVMGYDFGGQDYYHALHLPFFDKTSHYILVWGNRKGKIWGNYDSFYGKLEKRKDGSSVENLLYPIEYWLKSIDRDTPEQKMRYMSNEYKARIRKENELYSKLQHANANSLDISEEEIEMEIYRPNETVPVVDIIQNVRENTRELFLDVKSLKLQSYARVQDILSFDFLDKEVGDWLRAKIKSGKQTQKNQIVKSLKEFGEKIYFEDIVIIDKSSLVQKIINSEIQAPDDNLDVIINSLINNYYIIYPGKNIPELEDYYIVNIQKFTEYLYQVLSVELASNEKNQGYFTKNEAYSRILIENQEIKEYVLEFLRKTEVIFEVEDSEKENPKFIAPTYLPNPKDKVELLFIDSFETPDCYFEFQSFFHPNLILQVIKHYKNQDLLVLDSKNSEYLIWKNCVVIFNLSQNEKKELEKSNNQNKKKLQNLLKLELLLPDSKSPQGVPSFAISRNNSAMIENDQFSEVFKEIKNLLSQYRPKIKVKTPYGNYIPFDDIQKLISEGKGKRSQFVYSDGVLYPKYDFRHFLPEEFNAPLKIFIAYSKFDDHYRLELRDHLQPGINEGRFIVFDDRGIEMGEKWLARIKKELEQCDVFILLISVKLLGTDFVINTEIPEAKKRMNKISIVPIMLSPCDWSKTGILDFNAYDKGQPLSLFNSKGDLSVNERAAKWQEIVKIIENLTPKK